MHGERRGSSLIRTTTSPIRLFKLQSAHQPLGQLLLLIRLRVDVAERVGQLQLPHHLDLLLLHGIFEGRVKGDDQQMMHVPSRLSPSTSILDTGESTDCLLAKPPQDDHAGRSHLQLDQRLTLDSAVRVIEEARVFCPLPRSAQQVHSALAHQQRATKAKMQAWDQRDASLLLHRLIRLIFHKSS
jgi:hypothetical protein